MNENKQGAVSAGFLKHSSIYALGNIATRVGSFLLLPLYTRHLSVPDYGALELFYVVSGVVSSLLSAGLAHATLRFYFEYDDNKERNKVVTSCLISTVIYAVPFVAILSHWNVPLAKFVFGDASLAKGFYLVFSILIFELMRQIGLAYFRAREYSTMYVAVCLLQLVLQVGCNVYTVGFRNWGVIGILKGNLVSIFAGWALVMFVVVRECGIAFDFNKMKKILNYSYPFLLTAIIGVILSNLDRIILRAFFSLREVGLYALAFKFGSLVQELIIEPFNRSFGAHRFKIMNQENSKQVLVNILTQFILMLTFVGLGISLISHDVIRLMTDPSYWEAYHVIPFVVLAFIMQGAGYSFQTGILYEKKTHNIITINVLSAAFNVLFYLFLIPWLGIYGAALSVMGKSLVESVFTYVVSQRCYPIPYEIGKALKIVGIGFGLVVFAGLIPENSVWVTLPINAILLVLFPFILFKVGALSMTEIDAYKTMAAEVWTGVRSRLARG